LLLILRLVTVITVILFSQHQILLGIIYTCCLIFFSTSFLIILYVSYELVILPIVVLIITAGWYSERIYACIVILGYTLIFRIPGLPIILIIQSTWITNIIMIDYSLFANYWLRLIFAVKLPIWGLHYWLPLAHVEAPTRGRIMLAGILLKLGGYGLIRLNIFITNDLIIFFLYGLIIRTLICCTQLDLKRIVAYSSISHIMIIPLILNQDSNISYKIINLIIFTHAFSRIALFFWVGLIYKCTQTRNIIQLKGLFYRNPQLSIFYILLVIINISIPPFIRYFAEVLRFLHLIQIHTILIIPILIFFILSLVYILNPLGIIISSKHSNPHTSYTLNIMDITMLTIIIFISNIFVFCIEIF